MALFRDDQDAQIFLSLLWDAVEASGCVLWAYLLMTNHFHLAMRGSSDQLSCCMQRLGRLYSRYHNTRYGLSGAAFEGRYESYPQGTLPLLLRTIAYIFMNPVAAGMASLPDAYAWSSYWSFFGDGSFPLSANVATLLARIAPEPAEARETLRRFLERESRRIQAGQSRPGLTARDVQANHFDWLLEEASAKIPLLEGQDPLLLAVYWAQLAGFHRSAIAKALGGTMNATFRKRLSSFRIWIVKPGHEGLAQLP